MAAPTLSTPSALYTLARTALTTVASHLTDYSDGANLDALTHTFRQLADNVQRVAVQWFVERTVAGATEDTVEDVILDRQGPERNAATYATIPLRLTRSSYVGSYDVEEGDQFSLTAPDGTELTYTVSATQVGTMGSGDSAFDFFATAEETGRDYNVDAGPTITATPSLPSGLTVSQTARASGGAPIEPIEDYKARFALYKQTLRRGTVPALETGCLEVDGVSVVGIDESEMAPVCEGGSGAVFAYVGDPDATGNDTLAASAQAALETWRAAGVRVLVVGSAAEGLTGAYTVKVAAGTDVTTLGPKIKLAIEAYAATIKPSKSHFAGRAENAGHNVDRSIIYGVTQTTPSTEVTAPSNNYEAIRMPVANITLTWEYV